MYPFLYMFLGFGFMEFSGLLIHKYIMHGPLWFIHKTHHEPSKGYFELNDVFSLLFAGIATVLIIVGVGDLDYRFWLGIGITLYGMSYFLIHDVLVHRRLKWFSRAKNKFLLGILRAHQAHHVSNMKHDGVSFGLFVVRKKYYSKK